MLVLKTALWYVPLLELNTNHAHELRRLFAPFARPANVTTAPGGGGKGHALGAMGDFLAPGGSPILDVFGPLLRFLLVPKPAVRAAASKFLAGLLQGRHGHSSRMPLVGIHVRTQDSTHNTHTEALGAASRSQLESAVGKCATSRIKRARHEHDTRRGLREQSKPGGGWRIRANAVETSASGAPGGVAVFVASDHDGVRRRLVKSLRSVPGVAAAQWYDAREGGVAGGPAGFEGEAASRRTRSGFLTAAIELTILSHADHLVQAGNMGFSSYGLTAAGMGRLHSQALVTHPCAAQWSLEDAGSWERMGFADDDADCLEQLRPQPWLNLRWPLAESPVERRRVTCPLVDPADGKAKPLVNRLDSLGALELTCEDLKRMAEAQGKWQTAKIKQENEPRTMSELRRAALATRDEL